MWPCNIVEFSSYADGAYGAPAPILAGNLSQPQRHGRRSPCTASPPPFPPTTSSITASLAGLHSAVKGVCGVSRLPSQPATPRLSTPWLACPPHTCLSPSPNAGRDPGSGRAVPGAASSAEPSLCRVTRICTGDAAAPLAPIVLSLCNASSIEHPPRLRASRHVRRRVAYYHIPQLCHSCLCAPSRAAGQRNL